jgi:hypothetical protein
VSVVEALIAVAMLGIAGASLCAAFAATTAARRHAAADTRAADATLARIAWLSRRSCVAADTAGLDADPGGSVAWTARRNGAKWVFTDSVRVNGVRAVTATGGFVACA